MAKDFGNPLFSDALNAVFRDCEAHKPPPIILEGIILALEHPVKLLCWVGDIDPTIGTSRPLPGFYASDLFVELMQAVRALDWKVVSIILEQATSPQKAAKAAQSHQ